MVAQLDAATVRARPTRAAARLLTYGLFEGRPATTKGQWINPLVRAQLRAGARSPVSRPVVRPIVVVGIGRSGTTLLGRLLGVHRDVGFLNEPKALWHEIVADEDLIGTYGPEPVRLWLDETDATPERIRRAHRLYGWYLSCTRSRRVVDKYPELVYRAEFVRALFPDAEIVAIARRPWDVVTSIDTWSATKGTEQADWWGVDDRKWRVLWQQGVETSERWRWIADHVDPATTDQQVRGTVEWLVGTAAALDLPHRVGAKGVHLVRYEDLVADPGAFLDDLLGRLGLTPDPVLVGLATRDVAATREAARPPASVPAPLVEAVDAFAARAGFG